MRKQGTVYLRGNIVWIRYPHPTHGNVQSSTELDVRVMGTDAAKAQARVLLDKILTDIANGIGVETGPLTLRRWFETRKRVRKDGVKELRAVENHGGELLRLELTAITPARLQAWAQAQQGAPRSVLHRWSTIRTALRDAVIAGHLQSIPIMPPGSLPARLDADPDWRAGAIFELSEAQQLITDERIDLRRRVLYAIKFLTGARHGEAVGLRWSSIDWHAQPLPRIVISRQYLGGRTKTASTKIVPMHPALQALVKAWRAAVTERDGAAPADDARILDDHRGRPEPTVTANPRLHGDLRMLALRPRDGHDMRATFICAALTSAAKAGVPEFIVRNLTHAAAETRDAFAMYQRDNYEQKCAVVAALPIRAVALQSRYAVANSAASLEDSGPDHMTVFGSSSGQERTPVRDSAHLQVVKNAGRGQDGTEVDSRCSAVADTDPRDAQIAELRRQVQELRDMVLRR